VGAVSDAVHYIITLWVVVVLVALPLAHVCSVHISSSHFVPPVWREESQSDIHSNNIQKFGVYLTKKKTHTHTHTLHLHCRGPSVNLLKIICSTQKTRLWAEGTRNRDLISCCGPIGQSGSGAHTLILLLQGTFLRGQSARGIKLITHLHLVQVSRILGAMGILSLCGCRETLLQNMYCYWW